MHALTLPAIAARLTVAQIELERGGRLNRASIDLLRRRLLSRARPLDMRRRNRHPR